MPSTFDVEASDRRSIMIWIIVTNEGGSSLRVRGCHTYEVQSGLASKTQPRGVKEVMTPFLRSLRGIMTFATDSCSNLSDSPDPSVGV
ncbi:hypothetical protein EVAR_20438_1 [Eumeta japonica]|uniref:Uncharacterized protein n=1 Tax=Eumeta variegata TaxID=151549 RepID=A0A4C1TZ77_EUMVA|nr:hypothetical protein EVAR_20438_1 [Eumeta japonica]